MSYPLKKCISLGGYGPLTNDGADDYRQFGNGQYILDSNTRWVKLWVSWYYLAEEYRPSSFEGSQAHLNSAPAGQRALERLDAQIKAINNDSDMLASQGRGHIGVILTVYPNFPTWSSAGTYDQKVDDAARFGRAVEAKLPDDRTTNGPWGWFISHLLCRYHWNSPQNPYGARIVALEFVNEPNYMMWPQTNNSGAGMSCWTAEMMTSAENLAAFWGWPATGQWLMGPATADGPDPNDGYNAQRYTDWRTFTDGVLVALGSNWSPRMPFVWTHHNYRDIRLGPYEGLYRVTQVANKLSQRGWKRGTDHNVWLTEGGYVTSGDYSQATLNSQATLIRSNYASMGQLPYVPMFTQHCICDSPFNSYNSGVRRKFIYGPPASAGAPKEPYFTAWKNEFVGSSDW
jgi:hypothetical protein